MDPEGNTYEKSAIMAWLKQNSTSPLTRKPLTADMLIPNRALRDLIEQQQQHPRRPSGHTNEIVSSLSHQESEKSVQFRSFFTGTHQRLEISGPDQTAVVQPAHICCVIDVSGSMGDLVELKDQMEQDGMTLMDITKHACRTIIESLTSNDRFSLVSFSTDAQVLLSNVAMTQDGKRLARSTVDTLQPDGSTNLAAGVRVGVETASLTGSSHFCSVFVLTDGVPSEGGLDYKGAVKRQLKAQPLLGTIHTFGFGYNLDSALLRDIARAGDGVFAFIPDAGMVGTVFVNAIANVRTVYGVKVELTMPLQSDKVKVLGHFREEKDKVKETQTLCLPSLRYGQPLSVVIKTDKEIPNIKAAFSGLQEKTTELAMSVSAPNEDSEIYQEARAQASELLFSAAENNTNAQQHLKPTALMNQLRSKSNELDALLKDLEGQVGMAFSRPDWFNRWGKHYLISIAFAHAHQICNNFKDPGVQVYGGELFKQLQQQLNDTFLALPPPIPSGIGHQYGNGYQGSAASGTPAPAPIDMSRYYDAGGVCFHPSCPVLMENGQETRIMDLKKGDRLSNGATVICILRTDLSKIGGSWLVQLGSSNRLWLTPYHPIYHEDAWVFPVNVRRPCWAPCTAVYNVVLDSHHEMIMDDVTCITLGHGRNDDPVLQHTYFGTNLVIQDLTRCDGWASGLVNLKPQQIRRSDIDNRIFCIQKSAESRILIK